MSTLTERDRAVWITENKRRVYLITSFTIFTAILLCFLAVVHIARLAYGWELVIGGVRVPFWVSMFALVIVALTVGALFKKRGGG